MEGIIYNSDVNENEGGDPRICGPKDWWWIGDHNHNLLPNFFDPAYYLDCNHDYYNPEHKHIPFGVARPNLYPIDLNEYDLAQYPTINQHKGSADIVEHYNMSFDFDTETLPFGLSVDIGTVQDLRIILSEEDEAVPLDTNFNISMLGNDYQFGCTKKESEQDYNFAFSPHYVMYKVDNAIMEVYGRDLDFNDKEDRDLYYGYYSDFVNNLIEHEIAHTNHLSGGIDEYEADAKAIVQENSIALSTAIVIPRDFRGPEEWEMLKDIAPEFIKNKNATIGENDEIGSDLFNYDGYFNKLKTQAETDSENLPHACRKQ